MTDGSADEPGGGPRHAAPDPPPGPRPGRRRLLLVLAAVTVLALLAAGFATWAWRSRDPAAPPRTAPSPYATPGSPSLPGSTPPAGSPSSGSPSASAGPAATPSRGGGGWWRPAPGLAWQWQLSGAIDRSVDVPVYDIDAVEASAADVAALHAAGRKVICYVNAGAYEPGRPDSGSFPEPVRGKELDGWPGERWLDVRRWDVLEPLMSARFEVCRAKGFDAVEPDNVDGYANESGFPLSAQDQLTYNRRLADLAHAKGLAIGLKNDVEQAAALEPSFDFAVNEECMQYDECGELRGFIRAGKPVFHVEYGESDFCARAREYGFSSMRKKLDLDAWREPC